MVQGRLGELVAPLVVLVDRARSSVASSCPPSYPPSSPLLLRRPSHCRTACAGGRRSSVPVVLTSVQPSLDTCQDDVSLTTTVRRCRASVTRPHLDPPERSSSMTALDLTGRKALVTGGAQGLGEGMAQALAAAGARGGGRRPAGGPRRQGRRGAAARGTGSCRLDVTDDAGWEAAVADATGQLGGLDIVVNNAGIEITSLIVDLDPDAVRRQLEVNLLGTVAGHQARLPHHAARRRGRRRGRRSSTSPRSRPPSRSRASRSTPRPSPASTG